MKSFKIICPDGRDVRRQVQRLHRQADEQVLGRELLQPQDQEVEQEQGGGQQEVLLHVRPRPHLHGLQLHHELQEGRGGQCCNTFYGRNLRMFKIS
jgi:hypothetical protein